MLVLTREQRVALKKVYDRCPIYPEHAKNNSDEFKRKYVIPITYRQFRRRATPEIGSFGALMVPWCNMWLGIEKDGYTHS